MRSFLLFLMLMMASLAAFAQEAQQHTEDIDLRLELQQKYKNVVVNYNRQQFDDLFVEFFTKTGNAAPLLTKEEFYTYTVKISIYSGRLGQLYKDQKDVSERTKREWFNKKYSDYLANRNNK